MTANHSIRYGSKEVIFQEGGIGAEMYLVCEGTVLLSIAGHPVEQVGPGGVFGELALIDRQPRTATATTQTDCLLMVIDRARFENMVRNTPSFALRIMEAMCERLRRTDRVAFA